MSWASRRRTVYLTGVIVFFVVIIGGPVFYHFATIKPTCFDGKQNGGETAVDKGGPCEILDERLLQPVSVMWARSFPVRDGSYTSVAYVENANPEAGVELAHYHFGLYDSQNVLIAERSGEMYIMSGGITPVLETGIDTGNRQVVHTYFTITDDSLVWKKTTSPAAGIKISDQSVSNTDSQPRIDATAKNSLLDIERNIRFIAVVFDPDGNAFAASGTTLPELDPSASAPITFVWPTPFTAPVGRVDIIPLLPPLEPSASSGE